jgi:hypothetical protein
MFGLAFAGKTSIEADVKGVDGRPSKGAEVRFERQDKKAAPMILKADARGHLVANNLDAGVYKVTATVEGGVTSTETVKVGANKSLVAFNMSKTAAMSGKTKKRYTWIPAETGTRFGGRWVESGDEVGAEKSKDRNLDRINGSQLDNIQRQSTNYRPPGAP